MKVISGIHIICNIVNIMKMTAIICVTLLFVLIRFKTFKITIFGV